MTLLEEFEKSPLYLAYKLVEEGKIDPWDVDLEKLITAYLEEIRKIELRDLRIPARVVAFAAFLIKKQLEILFPKPPRPRVKRTVTLQEIESEFEETPIEELLEQKIPKRVRKRKTSTSRKVKRKEQQNEEKLPPLHKAKLEEVLDYLLNLLEKLQKEEKIPFSSLAGKNDYVAKLWGLLNLSYEGKIELEQSKPFDEIYLKKI
jgi:segregation and condensation protein A